MDARDREAIAWGNFTRCLIGGDPLDSDSIVWTKFLIGFDVIFTSLALVLVEIILVG